MAYGGPTPSERRMEELCALRRPLEDHEVDEVRDLRVTIRKAAAFRRRYRENPEFREQQKARALAYWHRQQGGS